MYPINLTNLPYNMPQIDTNIIQSKEIKPINAKPGLYTYFYSELKGIAKNYGYNLVLHGSMNRDLDLIAIPWKNKVESHYDMVKEFDIFLNGEEDYPQSYAASILPGGRHSYVINMNRGGKFNGYVDEQYYVDISIVPHPYERVNETVDLIISAINKTFDNVDKIDKSTLLEILDGFYHKDMPGFGEIK